MTLVVLWFVGAAIAWSPSDKLLPEVSVLIYAPPILDYSATSLIYSGLHDHRFQTRVSKDHFIGHLINKQHPERQPIVTDFTSHAHRNDQIQKALHPDQIEVSEPIVKPKGITADYGYSLVLVLIFLGLLLWKMRKSQQGARLPSIEEESHQIGNEVIDRQ